jgi:hypothetical protein
MKTKLTTILAIVSMGCAVWLVGENRALKQINDGLLLDNVTLVKQGLWMEQQYIDLQEDYSRCFDEALRLEEENQLLGSLVGDLDKNDYAVK